MQEELKKCSVSMSRRILSFSGLLICAQRGVCPQQSPRLPLYLLQLPLVDFNRLGMSGKQRPDARLEIAGASLFLCIAIASKVISMEIRYWRHHDWQNRCRYLAIKEKIEFNLKSGAR